MNLKNINLYEYKINNDSQFPDNGCSRFSFHIYPGRSFKNIAIRNKQAIQFTAANTRAAPAAFQAANNVTGFIAYEVSNTAVNGNHSFYNVALVLQVNGKDTVRIEQVVSTTWKDGKIVNERYYHG